MNFPAEFAKLRKMIEKREARVWAVAKGEAVPADDRRRRHRRPWSGSRPTPRPRSVLTSPEESRRTFTLPEGYEANLFASEEEFPDLKKPVQMTFDAKGRLWVTTMASYPMYLPGRSRSTTRS